MRTFLLLILSALVGLGAERASADPVPLFPTNAPQHGTQIFPGEPRSKEKEDAFTALQAHAQTMEQMQRCFSAQRRNRGPDGLKEAMADCRAEQKATGSANHEILYPGRRPDVTPQAKSTPSKND